MKFLRIGLLIVSLLYPLAVYVGLHHFDARFLVLLLIAVAGLRLSSGAESRRLYLVWLPIFGLLILWTLISNSDVGLKLYPVLVSASFLLMFAWSLKYPPSMVERLARLREPNLPEAAVSYTANVTKVWCAFFTINGGIAFATAIWASNELWLLYNGLIAYILMAVLFAGEWLVRQQVVKANED